MLEANISKNKADFRVQVLNFHDLKEIQGAWASADLITLLESLDFGDTSNMDTSEVREISLLALQDLEPVEAAELLLTQRLGGQLNAGQINNVANEMLDEKLWEEYADLSMHEAMFNVASLLYSAFPKVFPKPDAIQLTLGVSATSKAGQKVLAGPLDEAFVVRLLADGMSDNSILHRLFEDQINGHSFPEADKIVWILEVAPSQDSAIKIQVTGSECWLAPLRETKSYSSCAYLDTDYV